MRLLRPDPRTGVIKVGQKISRPTIPPTATETLQMSISLTQDIGEPTVEYVPPVVLVAETIKEQQPDTALTQQIKVTSKPPKVKKAKGHKHKKLALKAQTG